ncbi:MAG: B12-binding domain-containing radical SAM protein [Methanobacterium sp.]
MCPKWEDEITVMKQDQLKILLIEPPFYTLFRDIYSLHRYPLSLGYLGGEIRKYTNWGVMVYNADFSPHGSEVMEVSYLAGIGFNNYTNNLKELSGKIWKEIELTIAEYDPTVVAISAKSQNFKSALIVAKLAKQINKQTVVIMGGPHPSMVGADLLSYPEIDISVIGEGEITITELLHAIEAQKKLDDIQGIIYREDGEVIKNPPRKFITNLDSLCFPHEFAPEILKDYNRYPITAFSNIFTIRGCPYNCFFCGSRNIWSRKVRFRSPENVVEEIKSLQKIGVKHVHFDDDTFGVSKKHLNDLCNALMQHCPGLKWSCEIPVHLVNEQNISLMKSAGCSSIQIGIESGNNEILSAIRKNITIEEALDACELIKKHGIALGVFFIVGFPQDTEDTLRDTITAIKKVKSDRITYSIFTPYPGTEAFELCKEKGLIGEDYDVSLYNHQSPLNNFCMNIPKERFRLIVSEVEKQVDRKNSVNRYKQIVSLDTFRMIRQLGIGESLKQGLRIFTGK